MNLVTVIHVTEGGACHPAAIPGGWIILAVTVLTLAIVTSEGARIGTAS